MNFYPISKMLSLFKSQDDSETKEAWAVTLELIYGILVSLLTFKGPIHLK